MLTNRRVLMLLSPASHTREQKELTDPCTIQWEMQWNNLLAVESNEQNAVLLHLRDSTKEFTHIISCDHSNDPETTQATEIYSAIQQQWRAYCPTPEDPSKAKKSRRLRRRLKRKAVWETGKSGRNSQASSGRSYTEESGASGSIRQRWEVQEAPTTSRDDEFRHETSLGNLIWNYHYKDGSCPGSTAGDSISFWRPDPPPGYVSVGDVAYTGDFPESQTVIVYRNDAGSFEKPLGFDLIWRNWKDGIESPISIWMPRAPEGYVALGCVVCADYEEPQLDAVWGVYSDLTEETHLEDSTIWQAPSEALWQCCIYPVASEVKTFIALRGEKDENTPKPSEVVD